MSPGFLSLVISSILLGSAFGRPRRHSKRVLSQHEIEEFARPPPVIVQSEDSIKTRVAGGKIKVQTRPNYIPDKIPSSDDNKTTHEEKTHQIPPKEGESKGHLQQTGPITHRPVQNVESTTSEYFTQSTRVMSSTPPWWDRQQQFIDLFHPQKQEPKYNNIGGDDDIQVWEVLRAYRTISSEEATSTTPDFTKCHCDFIEHAKLYNYLVDADNNGYDSIPYYKRLDLFQMGLYSNEQAKRCYHYCRHRTPSVSYSYTSKNVPTYGPIRQNEIEIVTGAVDPDAMSMIRGRQHCYQTLKSRNVTVNDRDLCYTNYKPTQDSPQPSSKPKGLHVWTCCKTITPRGYY